MSKLDRFLISKDLMESCPNISAITLDRYLSDHRPILLREVCFDYDPTPFRFYHYWFEIEGFDKFVKEVWNEPVSANPNPMIRLMTKLKHLKKKLRTWINAKNESYKNQKLKLKGDLIDFDKVLDSGDVKTELLNKRINVMNSLQDLNKLYSLEVTQKIKIKWSIEGDENSKYFHGILNKRRNNLAIRGILVDGVWIDSPNIVKKEFLSHFENRFDCHTSTRFTLNMIFPNQLTLEKQDDMERNVTKEEIKKAVDDCGLDKSPGPDGFTFGFYRRTMVRFEYFDHCPLECFFRASGLHINMHKSKLMGIAVDEDRVNHTTRTIRCLTLKSLFSYLGIKVGGLMSRIISWDEIVNKLLARLSKWKMKTLSIEVWIFNPSYARPVVNFVNLQDTSSLNVLWREIFTVRLLLGGITAPQRLPHMKNERSLEDWEYLHFSVCSGTETEEGPWLELQFSLVDNSKLKVVYLLNRS
nr:RNA-directed DNA polymerase, eukaryota [Tanacetum cinerariifolium]